ncbi:hypothetical protein G6L26_021460 [Agrobacterium radiobacter]|uniref:DUF3299 domain-containing protein n=1 Tax=Agrobacterium tumefaciens str. B6 TaxID=1183423 RepID=A0A822V6X3_AGRTU|nr:hypothetical protein [Agrobacterium tumefaciens]AYM08308.1 hypothetical protein At1D1460_40670 [Agrobacterium tumefaciens]KWT85951.1 hypothetical protein ASB65_23495 [Agrobacterium tumefaciens str. B6]MQB26155.1 hypothetical protein [Agrobacterium tumefaciens]NSZ35046.1 hypothetical protein [Agrobacterium tumefaciens]NTA07727.1 hypothetical protein [Agrobacterium tumefaciens]
MSKADRAQFNRRQTLGLIAGLPLLAAGARAQANSDITFDELYGKVSVLGLEFSEKVKQLNGKEIAMRGFMAPPLKAEAQFFVLTEIPMSICPFCSTDADWPDNIVVVYLGEKQTFTQPSQTIEVRGTLETGSWTDPDTGFVSLLRIRQAEYATV